MQFGYSGTLERHGFARNRIWALDDEHPPINHNDNASKVSVDLILKPSEDDLKCWPHWYAFVLDYLCLRSCDYAYIMLQLTEG
jgi:glucose-6-phosphate 1-epimerase